MKLKYQKPLLSVEAYAVSQSIASCSTKISLVDSACILDDDDATSQMKDLAYAGFFLDGCEITAIGMDGADSICYHTNANATFIS